MGNPSEIKSAGLVPGQYLTINELNLREYKKTKLEIRFSFAQSPFGNILLASTEKGLCWVSLVLHEPLALEQLEKNFPGATFVQKVEKCHQDALLFFQKEKQVKPLELHLKGTSFQLKVWRALLDIPMGAWTSYGEIARRIGHPKACRAVGSAVGDNPVFFLIPCHRVLRANGILGNYLWGAPLKATILDWERFVV